MRSLNSLVWRNLTAHLLRSILTALAIALGVGMVLAATIVGQAASRSAMELSDEGPRIDLDVSAREGGTFDQTVLDRLRASPDVERASPSLRVEVKGVEPDVSGLTLLGVEPQSYVALFEPELANGTFLARPDAIVLPMTLAIDSGLNVGDKVVLEVGENRLTFTVSGRLKLEQDVTALDEATVAYVPLAMAQTLSGTSGRIDHIAVVLRPGADLDLVKADLAAQLGDELVIVPVVGTRDDTFATAVVQIGLAMVGVIMLFAAAFVIMNAFAISVTARTREIGALRALGMTRRQVMYAVLAEASLLGLAGALIGVLLGIGLAWGVMWTRGTLEDVPFAVPLWGVAVSVTMGLAVTLIGALQPARRASRVSPLTALRAASTKGDSGWVVRHGGRVGGIFLLILLPALTAAALVLQPDFFGAFAFLGMGMVGLLLGAVLLMPALVQPVARLVEPALVRWVGTAGRLAADNLTRNRLRTVLTAGALTIGLTTIIATSALLTASLKGGLNILFGLFHEDGMVIPDIPALLASGKLSVENSMDVVGSRLDPALVEAVTELDVGTVVVYGFAPVPAELSTYPGAPGIFVDPQVFIPLGNFDFFEGDAGNALEMMQRGRALLLMPLTAERLGVGVGDVVVAQTSRGAVEFTVAGIGGTSTDFTVFSWSDGETYFDLSGPSWLGIVVAENRGVDEMLARVDAAIAPFEDVVVFDMRESGVGGLLQMIGQLQTMLNALLLLAVVVAGLGVVNTVVINVTERWHEIALLRAVGATQRQIRQSVVVEAAALGLMAALIASVLGLGLLMLFVVIFLPNGGASVGMRINWETVGATLPPALRDWGVAAALSLVFGPLVAALAAYYPARQAAAMDVVEATRSERVALRQAGAKRPEGRRPMARVLAWTMAWRNLVQSRTRTALSALAVALGAAMTVAADIVSASLMNSVTGSQDAQTFMTGLLDQLDSILTLVGVGITFAAGFLIFNAFAMSVTQRRQQIGSLRALGMARRQVLRLVLAEALVVGSVGTLFGLSAGPLLGKGTIALMKALLGEGLFAFSASSASPSSLLLAAALGMGITLLSALIPAWRATRVSPLVALQTAAASGVARHPVGSALVGGWLIAGLAIYLVVSPPGEWIDYPWDAILAGAFVLVWLVCLALVVPVLIGGTGGGVRRLLARLWGATGRLIADNLQRGRGRVTLTILTLAVALTMIVGLTGFIHFTGELLIPTLTGIDRLGAWVIAPFAISEGMSAYSDMDALELPPELMADLPQVVEGRARIMDEWRFTIVPELSFFGSSYFSLVTDPHDVRQSGDVFFTFIEGDWQSAMPIMEKGCGVLITPLVAGKNGVALGETFDVTGARGPVPCTVAGIGRTFVNASIVSLAASHELAVTEPFMLFVVPLPGADRNGLEADILAVVDRYPDAHLNEQESMYTAQLQVMDALPHMLNALLLLAVVAAALGVVNTTMMGIVERRRELGLLRAVGATRRQVTAVIAGEAALMGLIGGGLGLVAGAGVVAIIVVTYGGNSWGVPDLDVWAAAWRSVQPALANGLIGIVAAPFICAGAAWLPVRAILSGSAVETLQAERRQPISPRRAAVGLLRWGSIRARFVLGTGVLMLVVLAGLIGAVAAHERSYLEDVAGDTLVAFLEGQAGLIELNLPDDAQTLDLSDLPVGQFDADAMLRFRALMDDMSARGLEGFAVADRDNVALLTLDPRDLGTVLPELERPEESALTSERKAGEWRLEAAAPIRSGDGLVVGSVRMALNLADAQDLLRKTRGMLWVVGGGVILAGLALSWGLATPWVGVTEQLSAHAARVAQGEYVPLSRPRRRGWSLLVEKTSLRTRLTAAMVLVVVLLVGALEGAVIPIERSHTESKLKDGLVAAAGWMGQATSEALATELLPEGPLQGQTLTLDRMLDLAGTMDWARLQELSEQSRGEDVAYVALVDEKGIVQLSDQLALIGEAASVPAETQIERGRWRDEEIWVISTPLRRGQDGERIGALQLGVRRAGVEAFLDESRTLFRLTGLIAVLAGVLLAQVIGGAVTAPVRQLAADTRRVGEGDLDVQFRVEARDELALLARAFDHMVAGLREREWLRDMFGRFVSREVAEAIRTGQVRLEGENRVVSVLFCDIRAFTARSARSTPEEVVALLNEYLPVVVGAAQKHGGTVNKFGGDSTLIIYGAPRPLQESAYRAVLTAMEMRTNLEALNARLVGRGEEAIRIGVGINTGVALAGAVGPKERQEYTVIGDAVNLASRIEALNKEYPDYDVLISGWTYEALGSRRAEFEFTDLGEVPIRGKAEPVRVWAVVRLKG